MVSIGEEFKGWYDSCAQSLIIYGSNRFEISGFKHGKDFE